MVNSICQIEGKLNISLTPYTMKKYIEAMEHNAYIHMPYIQKMRAWREMLTEVINMDVYLPTQPTKMIRPPVIWLASPTL